MEQLPLISLVNLVLASTQHSWVSCQTVNISPFLVADRVTVISKSNDDDQYIWESDSNSFKIAKDPRGNTLERGTEVILHLKDEAKEYLQPENLRKILKKYSQFVSCPIRLWESRTEKVEEDAEEESAESSDDVAVC